jgi:hypothetical protein
MSLFLKFEIVTRMTAVLETILKPFENIDKYGYIYIRRWNPNSHLCTLLHGIESAWNISLTSLPMLCNLSLHLYICKLLLLECKKTAR